MKKKTMIIICVFVLVVIFGATTALATSYNSTFSFTRSLTGGTRTYQGGSDMAIRCWDTSLTIDSGYELINTPVTYKVTLYKGNLSQGTVSGFPITSTAYRGTWSGKGPGTSTLEYKYKFTAVNTKTTNNQGSYKYARIHGDCRMFSE